MPHKRNPISAETISGLSRVLRGNLQVGLQDVPLWHERDISHSSAERIVLPDSTALAYYMTRRMTSLLSNLEIDAARMRANLDQLHGVVYSQSVLLAMVSSGMLRDDAYRIVQECAARSIDNGTDFRSVLASDPRVTLGADELDAAFDPARVLRNAGLGIAALDAVSLQ
jgi:adenylosuccinate lyase